MKLALNKQFKLISRPIGLPTRDDFEYSETPIPLLNEGELLVKSEYISLDPAMRGWMNEGKSYIPPVRLGDVMRAGGVGKRYDKNRSQLGTIAIIFESFWAYGHDSLFWIIIHWRTETR